jgi:hypothetical protein
MTTPAVAPEQREIVLKQLRDGHDLASACAVAGIDTQVAVADHEFYVACGKAHAIGSGRLKAKLLERAIQNSDTHVIERALIGRERQQQEFPAAARPKDLGTDDSLAAKLKELSDDELTLVEWVLDGVGERPARVMTYAEGMFLAGQRQAAERGKRADQLPVSNPLQPLPRDRALAGC